MKSSTAYSSVIGSDSGDRIESSRLRKCNWYKARTVSGVVVVLFGGPAAYSIPMPGPTVNLTVHFSPDEIKMLRRIAETAKDRRTGAKFTPLAEQFGINRTAMVNFVMRLYPLRLAVGHTNETFHVTPLLVESLHELDNAPPPNRWQQFTTWFNSRWWSVPFYIIAVGLPALVGYVTMLKTLLEWFGVIEGAGK